MDKKMGTKSAGNSPKGMPSGLEKALMPVGVPELPAKARSSVPPVAPYKGSPWESTSRTRKDASGCR